MGSTFSGINTALTALYAQRRGLDIAGQNIANANTEGYTRQRVDLVGIGGSQIPAMFSTSDGVGNGVDVAGVERLRNTFLEARGRAEHASQAYLTGQAEVYTRVEQAFHEPSDTGVQAQLTDLWSAFHDLTSRPLDTALRSQLLQRASTAAEGIRDIHDGLSSLYGTTREQLDTLAAEVNNAAKAVADYNNSIVAARQAGLPANELADQRDLEIMKLATLTGATTLQRDDGSVDVLLGGSPLVYGRTARTVSATGDSVMPPVPTTDPSSTADPPRLTWTDDPTRKVVVESGKLASTLETLNTTLPRYGQELDQFANNLATTVNEQHKKGFDAEGAEGEAFFVEPNPPATAITAATLKVAITDPKKIAASATQVFNEDGDPVPSTDGRNANALALLAQKTGGPDASYRTLVVQLGVDSQAMIRRSDIQDVVTNDIDASREAEAGVNLDEEMTKLLQFQRAYEAAARVLSTIDGTLDTLINRTGAGR